MLENACMKDEPLPQPLSQNQQKERMGSISSISGPTVISPGGRISPPSTVSGVINEVHDES